MAQRVAPIAPCRFELDARDAGQDVDAKRRKTDLIDRSGRFQIRERDFHELSSK